jgi:diaminopimelate decarboxylase
LNNNSNDHGKFGCTVFESKNLLHIAKQLSLNVIGTSFHCNNNNNIQDDNQQVIQNLHVTKEIWNYAQYVTELKPFTTLDIGGGFNNDENFESSSDTIQQYIQLLFSGVEKIKVISESGCFWSESFATQFFRINGIKYNEKTNHIKYYINDINNDDDNNGHITNQTCIPFPVKNTNNSIKHFQSQLYTCDIYNSSPFASNCSSSSNSDYHSMTATNSNKIQMVGSMLNIDDWFMVKNCGSYIRKDPFTVNIYGKHDNTYTDN